MTDAKLTQLLKIASKNTISKRDSMRLTSVWKRSLNSLRVSTYKRQHDHRAKSWISNRLRQVPTQASYSPISTKPQPRIHLPLAELIMLLKVSVIYIRESCFFAFSLIQSAIYIPFGTRSLAEIFQKSQIAL